MLFYPQSAVERTMKMQEVILRAMAKRITWWQAAEILGISDRQMRRWHRRYEKFGYDGLWDRRRGRHSLRRVPLAQAERVLALYREKYFDFNVRHFSREAARTARPFAQLHLGEAGAAGSRTDAQESAARRASLATTAAALAGDAAASGRQRARLVGKGP